MTGPQHYAEAERLLALITDTRLDPRDPLIAACAQVHATLALAAATADMGTAQGQDETMHSWALVTA